MYAAMIIDQLAARAFAPLLLAALVAFAPASLAAASLDHPPSLAFDIVRKGSTIGYHTLRFTEEGARLIVDIEIRIKITFASIPVFRYEHDSREVWQDGQLVALDTRTNDDGEAFKVTARRDG